MGSAGEEAYVTLLTTDGYLPGAMVLAHSLRDNGTRKKLAAMVTTDSISAATIEELRTVYDTIIPVERIRNRLPANLYLMNRPDLDSAFTKVQLWKQLQYRKVVYVDSDIVSLRAPDELFNLPDHFSAAPDIGWPDLFNSGVMALTPNMGDYYALIALAERGISFDGADQGLLNMHFQNYNRLSFSYNCTPSGHYQYVPAYRHFQSTISMIHYIGESKPWRVGRDFGGSSGVYQELLGRWWATYDRHYKVSAAAVMSGQAPPHARIVQKYVAGEQLLPLGYSSAEPNPTIRIDEPTVATEEPMVESSADANYAGEPQAIAAPVLQEREFSAPHAEWNPAVQAPPSDAKPEAANFPQRIYSMSSDKELFQPPSAYPEPPRNMWYDVPQRQPPSKPKAIFPWEENQAPPTRVFPDEAPATVSEPVSKPRPQPISLRPSAPSGDGFSESPPPGSTVPGSQQASSPSRTFDEPMTPFSPSQVSFAEYRGSNAWDDNEGITKYVGALQNRRKGGTEIVDIQTSTSTNLSSPTSETPVDRRQGLRITEFPTEVERPSLPVTPAPIRRNMFWGSERDAEGNLPEAEGVVGQNDWNPQQQLEQLRRSSLLFAEEPARPSADAPLRTLPESSRSIVTSPQKEAANDIGFSEASQDPRATSRETITKYSTVSGDASGAHLFESDRSSAVDIETAASRDGPGVVWVDHSTAGPTFERVSSSSRSNHAHTTQNSFQSSETLGTDGTIETSTSQTLHYNPSSNETVRTDDH